MPYNPTWVNPYMQQQTAPVGQSLGQSYPLPMPNGYQQPVNGIEKVSGKDSLWQLPMPPNSVSKPYFDYNGKMFYVVNTDAAGAKTIETFDFGPHKDESPVQIDGAQFVSRQEYDEFVAKVSAALEVLNGVHAAVPTEVTAIAAQGANVPTETVDAGGHVGGGVGTPAK